LAKKPKQDPEPTKPAPEKTPLPRFEDTGAKVPPFAEYFERHIETIKTIQAMMETKLSKEPGVLAEQLADVERFFTKVKSMEAWANSYLDLAERERLVPYDRASYTDTDRQIELASACSRERRFRDVVRGLSEGIERRISLGQSLLKYNEIALRNGA
jgi:hypothetical protein